MGQDLFSLFLSYQISHGKGKGRAEDSYSSYRESARVRISRKERLGARHLSLQQSAAQYAYSKACKMCRLPLKGRDRPLVYHSQSKYPTKSTIYRTSPSFLMFIRSISSSASLPKRREFIAPVATPPKAKTNASHKRSKILSSDIDSGWDYLTLKRDEGAISDIGARDLFDFAYRIGTDPSIMKGCQDRDIRSSVQAGERLAGVIDALSAQRPQSYLDDRHWLCLVIIGLALRGEYKAAMDQWVDLRAAFTNDKTVSLYVVACHHMLLSLWRHSSLLDALSFIIAEDFFGAFVEDFFRVKRTGSDSTELQSLVFATLTEMVLSLGSPPTLLSQLKFTHSPDGIQFIVSLMIRIYLKNGLVEEAYTVYTESEKQGLVLQSYLYMELIRYLAKEDKFYRANALFSAIVPNRKTGQHYHVTGLLLHSYQGRFASAEQHFDQLLSMDKATDSDVNLLMQSHAISGRTKQVVEIFERYLKAPHYNEEPVRPIADANIYHYSEIIFAHAQAADFVGMNMWLERMGRAGIPPNRIVYNIILKSFVMRGDLAATTTLLEQMREAGIDPDLISYTTLISLLAKRRDPIGAEAVYKRALSEGVSPDTKMISAVMNSHAEAGSWQGVVRAFDYLQSSQSSRLRLSINIYNVLIKAYVLAGTPFSIVSKVYQRMEQNRVRPTGRTFALLIQSACDSGDMSAALRLLSEMDKAASFWQNNMHIDVYVLTIIMSGFLRLGYKAQARSVYDEMIRRGIQPSGHTYAAILNSYANKNQGSIQIARDFLASVIGTDKECIGLGQLNRSYISSLEYMFAPLMDYFNKKRAPEEVEKLMHDLEMTGREPSLGALTILLDAYRRTANVTAALGLWPRIHELGIKHSNVYSLFQTRPSSETKILRRGPLLSIPLSVYIDLLSSAGYHSKVAEVWATLKTDGFHFDAHNWNHLVIALVRAGEPEHAFEVVEKVIIPYKEQSDAILAKKIRYSNPPSPLYFDDDAEADADVLSVQETHHIGRRLRSRSYAMRGVKDDVFRSEVLGDITDDFAHPLHVLHSMTPAWNSWRPHSLTLSVLAQVLGRLTAGGLIQPTKIECDSEHQIKQHTEDGNATEHRLRMTQESAAGTLQRIYNNYPKAVQIVRSWKLRQQFNIGNTQSDTYDNAH